MSLAGPKGDAHKTVGPTAAMAINQLHVRHLTTVAT